MNRSESNDEEEKMNTSIRRFSDHDNRVDQMSLVLLLSNTRKKSVSMQNVSQSVNRVLLYRMNWNYLELFGFETVLVWVSLDYLDEHWNHFENCPSIYFSIVEIQYPALNVDEVAGNNQHAYSQYWVVHPTETKKRINQRLTKEKDRAYSLNQSCN